MDGQEFRDSFLELCRKLIDPYDEFIVKLGSEKLKDFQPDIRSAGFGGLISFLSSECDNFSGDYDNKEFYDSIKDRFLKFQKVLNK